MIFQELRASSFISLILNVTSKYVRFIPKGYDAMLKLGIGVMCLRNPVIKKEVINLVIFFHSHSEKASFPHTHTHKRDIKKRHPNAGPLNQLAIRPTFSIILFVLYTYVRIHTHACMFVYAWKFSGRTPKKMLTVVASKE